MSTLTLEREFSADPKTVFSFITQAENVEKWWGPEGIRLKDHQLDLTRPGAWTSTMVNAEGGMHKVSGVVTAIDPPNWVEFTWAWHDENDQRGYESQVRLEVKSNGAGGTRFLLIHSGLADEESARNHRKGWESSLNKLVRLKPSG